MKTMTRLMVATPMLMALTIAGCDKPQGGDNMQKDVSSAQVAGRDDAARQQRDDAARMANSTGANGAGSGSMTDGTGMRDTAILTSSQADVETAADAAYKVDKANAEAAHNAAKQKCESMTGNSKTACMKTADTEHEAAQKAADTHRMAMRNGTPHTMPPTQSP